MAKVIADKIRMAETSSLIPYARNSRTHSDEQVAQLAASIQEFGFTAPILVGDENVIIAGHGRLLAAQKLGMEKVPTVDASGWSDAQRRAYVIADNKLALNAGWDVEMLSLELTELEAEGFDVELTGFDLDEISKMADESVGGADGEDDAPPLPAHPITVEGDTWLLGPHRVMCGDSTNAQHVEELLSGQPSDLIFTDPPYGMSYGGGRSKTHSMISNDDLEGEELRQMVSDAIGNAKLCAKEGSAVYVCLTWRTYADFEASMEKVGLESKACIVWDKKSIGLGNADYRPQHEFIFYSGGQWYGNKAQSDVWYLSRGATGEYVHPTQKPVELIERAVLNSSKKGDVVHDCFGGSGSTLVACEKTGRHARLMELDPKYCDAIVQRWQDFTGQTAQLEGAGCTFEELRNERQKAKADAA